jgi:lincosamide nucleotidyltransferase A/C/D/E
VTSGGDVPAAAVVQLLRRLDDAGIDAWLDGGWGVDALLGEQTRAHHDLDLMLRVVDVPRFLDVLEHEGFLLRRGSPPHAFVLVNSEGLEVDVHAVAFDAAGNGIHRMEEGGEFLVPAEGFAARGTVGGRSVRCLSAPTQILCHAQGYAPSEKDFHDMQRLAQHLGLELPPGLTRPSRRSP